MPRRMLYGRYKDWGNLLTAVKNKVIESVNNDDDELNDHIRYLINETDDFHPFETEEELSSLPETEPFCSKSEGEEIITEILGDMVKEIQENIKKYFSDTMNFAPEQADVANIELKFKEVNVSDLLKHFTIK